MGAGTSQESHQARSGTILGNGQEELHGNSGSRSPQELVPPKGFENGGMSAFTLAGSGTDKADFLKAFATDYGYQGRIDALRREEFSRLGNEVYVDHAGATLYSEKQIADIFQVLASGVFGNPHSQHSLAQGINHAQLEGEARALTLSMCKADPAEYECVFTSGATGALKLVGELFPWGPGTHFWYTRDNHNSVLGLRELAMASGGVACAVQPRPKSGSCGASSPRWSLDLCSADMQREGPGPRRLSSSQSPPGTGSAPACLRYEGSAPGSTMAQPSDDAVCGRGEAEPGMFSNQRTGQDSCACSGMNQHLFAFPLESNFSGAQHDPALPQALPCRPGAGTPPVPLEVPRASASGQPRRDPGDARGIPQDGGSFPGRESDRYDAAPSFEGPTGAGTLGGQSGGARIQGGRSTGASNPGEEPVRAETLGEQSAGPGTSRDRWWVLVDAAKACSSCPPDLRRHPADFVVLSYYKIFGYPTGLGALLIKKEALPFMRKAYFGGGTVTVSIADSNFFRRRAGAAGLEDGTVAFLDILALPRGFAQIRDLGGFPAVHRHVTCLTRYTLTQLQALRHYNGQAVCVVYGAHEGTGNTGNTQKGSQPAVAGAVGQGPVIAFNLLRPDGSFVGYREVEKLAGLWNIRLRTGCFCNPGACAWHMGLTSGQMRSNFEAGHVCWDDHDIVDGTPTGAVRISFGYMSTFEDAVAVLAFVRECFVKSVLPTCRSIPEVDVAASSGSVRLQRIWVYPIKSCGGFSPTEWPLCTRGLLWDREWALIDASGATLTQKRYPRLATIRTNIDLSSGVLQVSAPGVSEVLVLPLPAMPESRAPPPGRATKANGYGNGHLVENAAHADRASSGPLIKVCGDTVCSIQVEESGEEWWERAVGTACRLIRQAPGSRTSVKRPLLTFSASPAVVERASTDNRELSFANEGQLLLMSSASLADLNRRLEQNSSSPVMPDQFRPNLLVGGGFLQPFQEDSWSRLQIGAAHFDAAGPCARCEMVTLDQASGQRSGVEPLKTLAGFRRQKGRIFFGALFNFAPRSGTGPLLLKLSDVVTPARPGSDVLPSSR
eukprot:jgi/Botrbrau1/9125/Bobra.160_3s0002.1